MWKAYLPIFNFIKFVFVFLSAVFFVSCDQFDKGGIKGPVNSGLSQIQRPVFSKKCATGSFSVYGQSSLSSAGALSATSPLVSSGSLLQELSAGDKVRISGRITDGSPCHSGPVSFNCSARVSIDQNRSFICEQGNVVLSGGASLGGDPGTYRSPSTSGNTLQGLGGTSTPYGGRPFIAGDFMTFGNGHQAYGRIALGSSSSLVPQATCIVSFSCL